MKRVFSRVWIIAAAALAGLVGTSSAPNGGGVMAADAARLKPSKVAFIVAEDAVCGPVWRQDLYRVKAALAVGGAPVTQLIIPQAEHNQTIHPSQDGPFFFWRGAPG